MQKLIFFIVVMLMNVAGLQASAPSDNRIAALFKASRDATTNSRESILERSAPNPIINATNDEVETIMLLLGAHFKSFKLYEKYKKENRAHEFPPIPFYLQELRNRFFSYDSSLNSLRVINNAAFVEYENRTSKDRKTAPNTFLPDEKVHPEDYYFVRNMAKEIMLPHLLKARLLAVPALPAAASAASASASSSKSSERAPGGPKLEELD